MKTSIQFQSLNRKKSVLDARTNTRQFRDLIRKHLGEELLKIELSKARRYPPSAPKEEPSLQQLERTLDHLLDLDRKVSELQLSDLLDLHKCLVPEDAELRQHPVPPLGSNHDPLPPTAIASALSRFFEWSQSSGFDELHALEQMTLSQIRLYEIYPFETFSPVTISLFSYYFLLADGYLLPCYRAGEVSEFYTALNAGLAFSTPDLINLNLRACERAYDLVLAAGKG